MNPVTLPRDTTFTPTPDPLLGDILMEMEDIRELKCVLRALWHINRRKGALKCVTLEELATDPVLHGAMDEAFIEEAMARAARRRVFARGAVGAGQRRTTVFTLNTESQRRALQKAADSGLDLSSDAVEPPPAPAAGTERPNVFALYEQEIGMITPLIAEALKAAEEEYPLRWIEQAIWEAARSGKRSWRYAEAILKRWKSQGRGDGEPGRHIKENDPDRYIQDYVKRRGPIPGT